jgi:hypothetical protein
MILVYIWLPEGGNVGHTSLQLGEVGDPEVTYISWWPATNLDPLKKAQGVTHSLAEDIECESRLPDITIELEMLKNGQGLNEGAIRNWWANFQSQNVKYGLGGKNCSWVVVSALKAGGSDRFFPWHKLNVKRNIPLKSFLVPMIVGLLQYMTVQGIPIVQAALKSLHMYIDSFAKEVKDGNSVTIAAVHAIDAFSSIWSPQVACTRFG